VFGVRPITVRNFERTVVHIVRARIEFLIKLANLQSKLNKDLHIEALCGEKCQVGEPFRESVTCMLCIAAFDARAL
jgi:hypothetical protein